MPCVVFVLCLSFLAYLSYFSILNVHTYTRFINWPILNKLSNYHDITNLQRHLSQLFSIKKINPWKARHLVAYIWRFLAHFPSWLEKFQLWGLQIYLIVEGMLTWYGFFKMKGFQLIFWASDVKQTIKQRLLLIAVTKILLLLPQIITSIITNNNKY